MDNGKNNNKIYNALKNDISSLSKKQRKFESSKENAKSIITVKNSTNLNKLDEKPISSRIYSEIDNDLARDNIQNDIPFADIQDL